MKVTVCVRVPVLMLPLSMTTAECNVLVADASTAICTTHCAPEQDGVYIWHLADCSFHLASSLTAAVKAPLCARPFDSQLSWPSGEAPILKLALNSDVDLVVSREHYQALLGIALSLMKVFYEAPLEVITSMQQQPSKQLWRRRVWLQQNVELLKCR